VAELLAIGQDLKYLIPLTTTNSNGSVDIKLTGNSEYHPEIRFTKADWEKIQGEISRNRSPDIPFNVPTTI
jgi:hypothetical protein